MVWYGMVWYGMVWYGPQQHQPKGTQHAQAISKEDKEDKRKLEPSVATGYVDGSTTMVRYGMVRNTCARARRAPVDGHMGIQIDSPEQVRFQSPVACLNPHLNPH